MVRRLRPYLCEASQQKIELISSFERLLDFTNASSRPASRARVDHAMN